MNGRIEFNSEEQLGCFLAAFSKYQGTAAFNCWYDLSRRKFILEFTGE